MEPVTVETASTVVKTAVECDGVVEAIRVAFR